MRYRHPLLDRLLMLSVLFCLLPFLFFHVGQMQGTLVAQEAWAALGHPHGPWHSSWQGLFVWLPGLVLCPLTFITGFYLAIWEKRFLLLVGTLLYSFIETVGFLTTLVWLNWTIQ